MRITSHRRPEVKVESAKPVIQKKKAEKPKRIVPEVKVEPVLVEPIETEEK